jgi:hypothetical protein
MRHLDCFLCQWHGLAIFRLGLPRSCCWSKSQTQTQIHITAKTTHDTAQQLYTPTFLLPSYSHWRVEEACWGQILLSGTVLTNRLWLSAPAWAKNSCLRLQKPS